MSTRPELKFTDSADQNGFYRKWAALAPAPPNTIRVSNRGDYYTVVGKETCELVADVIYKTRAVIKTQGTLGKEVYVTLSNAVFSQLVREFVVERRHRIEIYDKFWGSSKVVSPGNVSEIEDVAGLSMDTVRTIAALRVAVVKGSRRCGLSFVDTSSRKIGMCEFDDNELFTVLESSVVQLNICECIVYGAVSEEKASQDADLSKIVSTLKKCDVTVTSVKNQDFNATQGLEEDLSHCLDSGSVLLLQSAPFQAQKLALSSLAAISAYLELASASGYKLESFNLAEHVRLDSGALRALNVFPQGSSNVSLFTTLNACKTSAGARLLSQWLKQPLTDVEQIQRRQLAVAFFVHDLETRLAVQEDVLCFVPDISRLCRKFAQKKANLDDVVRVYQFILRMPTLVQVLRSSVARLADTMGPALSTVELQSLKHVLGSEWLAPLESHTQDLAKLQELVEQTVDLESMDLNKASVRSEFSDELTQLRAKLDATMKKMQKVHLDIADHFGKDPDKKMKLEQHHVHGWCMRVTRNDASAIRGSSRIVELQTVKSGVYFTCKELRAHATEYSDLESEYARQQQQLVNEIIGITGTYSQVLEQVSEILAKVDVLAGFAHVATHAPQQYTRPKLHALGSPDSRIVLQNARHPCLETQEHLAFIANDVTLNHTDREFLIVTGPNMGGKSTYVKMQAVLCLMTQVGSYIPADNGAEMALVDCILARVGASDSQLRGISTFMAEMLEMSSILKTATRDSLVIIDELGRGTSTFDGFGLAYAISEHIASSIHSFTMFTTHFHELTQLSDKLPNVHNLHVAAHVGGSDGSSSAVSNDITLLYKVQEGPSEKSFGVHVAEMVKFPSKIIAMAKRKASELENEDQSDDVVVTKKTKCTPAEVQNGTKLLKKVLQEWKTQWEAGETSEAAVGKLKRVIEKHGVSDDKFLQEVIQL